MKIAIRADASIDIGNGHVLRCVTLAKELLQQGCDILFICCELEGHLGDFLLTLGFDVAFIDKPVPGDSLFEQMVKDAEQSCSVLSGSDWDWVVVDHYALSAEWHVAIRQAVNAVFAIDDLANRPLDCDVLLDQTFGRVEEDYSAYVPADCKLFMGAEYALLGVEYSMKRVASLAKRRQCQEIRCILVSVGGGGDAQNVTGDILKALESVVWDKSIHVDVVLGAHALHLSKIKRQLKALNYSVQLHVATNQMSALMCKADLAIGAAGTTTWERCCLGLPAIVVELADNQKMILRQLSRQGAIKVVRSDRRYLLGDIQQSILDFNQNIQTLRECADNAARICSGIGVKFVASAFIPNPVNGEPLLTLRNAVMDDADLILAWQKHPKTRLYSNNSTAPDRPMHIDWMKGQLSKVTDFMWVIVKNERPAGVLRLNYQENFSGYLISILVDPEQYRQRVGYNALSLVKKTLPFSRFYAQIHTGNIASLSMFLKLGFTKVDGEMYCWESEEEVSL
jgi:UDP-2,4-diacetamido-2,4,6-trideoxy-beta-L-altropyranose hydrolase